MVHAMSYMYYWKVMLDIVRRCYELLLEGDVRYCEKVICDTKR